MTFNSERFLWLAILCSSICTLAGLVWRSFRAPWLPTMNSLIHLRKLHLSRAISLHTGPLQGFNIFACEWTDGQFWPPRNGMIHDTKMPRQLSRELSTRVKGIMLFMFG